MNHIVIIQNQPTCIPDNQLDRIDTDTVFSISNYPVINRIKSFTFGKFITSLITPISPKLSFIIPSIKIVEKKLELRRAKNPLPYLEKNYYMK